MFLNTPATVTVNSLMDMYSFAVLSLALPYPMKWAGIIPLN